MLEQLFGSRTRVKLLRLLLLNPEKKYYVRELTRILGEQINSVRRELENLTAIELVTSEKENQKKYFQANDACVLYDELQALVLKSHLTLEKDLIHGIKKLDNIKFLLVAGVFVEGDSQETESPTDILCVGGVDKQRLRMLIRRFRKDYPRDLKYTVMTEDEFAYRQEISDKFLHDILGSNNIIVINTLTSV